MLLDVCSKGFNYIEFLWCVCVLAFVLYMVNCYFGSAEIAYTSLNIVFWWKHHELIINMTIKMNPMCVSLVVDLYTFLTRLCWFFLSHNNNNNNSNFEQCFFRNRIWLKYFQMLLTHQCIRNLYTRDTRWRHRKYE